MDDALILLLQRADAAAAAGNVGLARSLLGRISAQRPDDANIWIKFAAMCRAGGDVAAALVAVENALKVTPLDFTALLLRASLLERADDSAADEAYARALAQRPDGDVPPQLIAATTHAERRAANYLARREQQLAAALASSPGDLTPERSRRLARFQSNLLRKTRPYHSEPSDFHYPGLVELEFHDRGLFPWLADLEAATNVLAEEFEAVVAGERPELVPYIQYPEHEPLRQWRDLNHSRDWTAIHLIRNGATIEANARQCPRTMALLKTLPQPDVAGCSPNAMFSLLAPRTVIPAHTGVANTRLVCHLPIIVPAGCWFRVGAETRPWRVGEAFIFDDTIEHEAANPSDELRVVFICDLWHPGLDAAERDMVRAIMSSFIVGPTQP